MNIQFAIKDNSYYFEMNPRGSRTIPFVSKATGTPLVKYASEIMIGKKIKDLNIKKILLSMFKEAVFLLQVSEQILS